ncbi:unnamed protein product [Rotaria sp. Silwood1]|nr:unnamed protein product [Rotaria sp. Silwood1]
MTIMSTIILENFQDQSNLAIVHKILTKLFLIFPHYFLGRGLFDFEYNLLREFPHYFHISPFQFDIVGRKVMCLSIEGFVFFIFAILVHYRFFFLDRGSIRIPKDLISPNEDDDLATERRRIYLDHDNISGNTLPVNQGECFGLLGINGSGKSTSFKIVIQQLDAVHPNLGYCSQFDVLDSLLTAREHLYLHACLRGIKRKGIFHLKINGITECLLKHLGLPLWGDRPIKQYSNGNKRKLLTAISLIGNPSIIFMDKPTTGMDACAKRFLWNCILTLTRKDHKSVIITFHPMEEGPAIMVSGEFKCLGSVQCLKTNILVRSDINSDTKNIINYIKERIAKADVKEEHNKMIHFCVSTNVPLYKLFAVLEKAREELGNIIEDYTVTQVTLDDIFVNFAKIQENQLSENFNVNNENIYFKRNFLYELFYRKDKNIIESIEL